MKSLRPHGRRYEKKTELRSASAGSKCQWVARFSSFRHQRQTERRAMGLHLTGLNTRVARRRRSSSAVNAARTETGPSWTVSRCQRKNGCVTGRNQYGKNVTLQIGDQQRSA